MRTGWAALALGFVLPFPATAAIIYDGGEPNGTGISPSSGWAWQFGRFRLEPGANIITGIDWYGAYIWFNQGYVYDGPAWEEDNFRFDILNEMTFSGYSVGGAITRTPTGMVVGPSNAEIWHYSMSFAPLELDYHDGYLFGILNFSSSEDTWWGWANSGVGSNFSIIAYPGRYEFGGGDGLAFHLTGPDPAQAVVPEPATLSLLGLGLMGIAVRFRKRAP